MDFTRKYYVRSLTNGFLRLLDGWPEGSRDGLWTFGDFIHRCTIHSFIMQFNTINHLSTAIDQMQKYRTISKALCRTGSWLLRPIAMPVIENNGIEREAGGFNGPQGVFLYFSSSIDLPKRGNSLSLFFYALYISMWFTVDSLNVRCALIIQWQSTGFKCHCQTQIWAIIKEIIVDERLPLSAFQHNLNSMRLCNYAECVTVSAQSHRIWLI